VIGLSPPLEASTPFIPTQRTNDYDSLSSHRSFFQRSEPLRERTVFLWNTVVFESPRESVSHTFDLFSEEMKSWTIQSREVLWALLFDF
jgi:hypothetical protein